MSAHLHSSEERRWRRFLLPLVFVLLLTPTAGAVVLFGSMWQIVLLIVGLVALLALVLLRRSSGDGDGEDADVWNAIPSWQYSGRHVESGGLSRGEQEQALRAIQDQAETIEAEQFQD